MFTVANAKDDLKGIGHGTSVKKITNISNLIDRAARNVLAKLNPDESKRKTQLEIYDGVFDYAAPADLKEKRLADLKPQVARTLADNFTPKPSEEFDIRKWNNWLSVEDEDAVKFLRVSKNFTPAARTLFDFNSLTGWSLSGDGSGLVLDSIIKAKGGYSFKFNLTASGSQVLIEGTLSQAIDLSDWDEIADLFMRVYLPDSASDITGVTLRWGNSDSVYWEKAGSIQRGSQLQGFNLFKFDWSSATETGTPVTPTEIDYFRIAIDFGGTAVAGIRLDDMFASVPHVFDLVYFSKYPFRDSSGTWKEKTTSDEDIVNLDSGSYNIFLYEIGKEAAQQRQGAAAKADQKYFSDMLHGNGQEPGLYKVYQYENPDQVLRRRGSYYRPR